MVDSETLAFQEETARSASPADEVVIAHGGGWQVRFNQMTRFLGAVTPFSDLQVLCKQAARSLCDVLGCDDAHLYLLSNSGDTFVQQAECHRADDGSYRIGDVDQMALPFDTGRIRQLSENRRPVVQNPHNPHPSDLPPDSLIAMGISSVISVPIATESGMHGFYSIAYKEQRTWDEDDLSFHLEIGCTLGILLEQTHLMRNILELEMLLDRKRLGEEIHDNLSQLLSLIAIRADAAYDSLKTGQTHTLEAQLEKLGAVSQKAFSVLKEEILYLKAPIDDDFNLSARITQHLERFARARDMEVTLINDLPMRKAIVSAHAELQLTRILHEALVNTARHSGANRVTVTLTCNESHVTLKVQDDGRGFNVDEVSDHSMGIRIMSERAIALYGKLHVESVEGGGTTVIVTAPLLL